jgi:hypothetical protein
LDVNLHILDPEPGALQEPQTRAVEEQRHQLGRTAHLLKNGSDLPACKNDREPPGSPRTDHAFNPSDVPLQYFPVEEQQRAESLVLC